MPGKLVKTQIAGPHLQNFLSRRSGVGSALCMANMYPGDADAAGPGTTLSEMLV